MFYKRARYWLAFIRTQSLNLCTPVKSTSPIPVVGCQELLSFKLEKIMVISVYLFNESYAVPLVKWDSNNSHLNKQLKKIRRQTPLWIWDKSIDISLIKGNARLYTPLYTQFIMKGISKIQIEIIKPEFKVKMQKNIYVYHFIKQTAIYILYLWL